MSSAKPKRTMKLEKIQLPTEPTGQQMPTPVPEMLDKKTTITIDDKGITIEIAHDNVETISELGRGAYGIVERVKHIHSGFEMAVKRISQSIVQEQKRLLMDMNVLVDSADCPNIVKFYGAIFWDGDLWLFMEILDSSLDKFYRLACRSASADNKENAIPENILGKIAAGVVKALHYLYGKKIIHRDIKPSNILISRNGDVKLCDFGISGHLVNSIAQTFEAGCKPYMAPERINPDPKRPGYDIRSDVWSLGISMLELAIGKFPYPEARSLFEILKRVCMDEPPRLPAGKFSVHFEDFISKCLQKDFQRRPYYAVLLQHEFIMQNENNDISSFVTKILDLEKTNK